MEYFYAIYDIFCSNCDNSTISYMAKILFLMNHPAVFLSHRLGIALAAKNAGYEVHVVSLYDENVQKIEEYGFAHHPWYFLRGDTNVFKEAGSLISLFNILRKVKPDLVHAVTIKPVLYGGLLTRITRTRAFVAAITGLGSVFIGDSKKNKLIRYFVDNTYKIALKHKNITAIFQNEYDKEHFVNIGAVCEKQTVMIRGSGVDMREYQYKPEPEGQIKIFMASRLLVDKGVNELIKASQIILEKGIDVQFVIAGSIDKGNPTSLTEKDVQTFSGLKNITYLGHRGDIAYLLQNSHIVVLPSYREGLPKCLIEAQASGRPVVTTDVPGCNTAIINNKTGILVPARNAEALAEAIIKLIVDKELRIKFGENARRFAEEVFNVENVVAEHLNIYRDLLGGDTLERRT